MMIGGVLCAAGTASVKIWDVEALRLERTLTTCRWPLSVVNGLLYAATADAPSVVQAWDLLLPDGKVNEWCELERMEGHKGAVTCLLPFRGGILSASTDCTITVWQK